MGFRYRKSLNLGGGFRVNISSSGVGYSWGTKGYRITRTAKGTVRRTLSIPGTGISFVNETRQKRKSSCRPQRYGMSADDNHYDAEEIVNGEATNMVSEGLEDLLSSARRILILNKLSFIGMGISLLLCFENSMFVVPFIGFTLLNLYIRIFGVINLDYTIAADQQETIDSRMKPLFQVVNSNRLWRIIQSRKVIDKKYAAGASSSVTRIACQASTKPPFPFRSNIPVISFKSKRENLVFLPDKLFVIQGTKIGALNYCDISMSAQVTKFVESDRVPQDAQIIGQTWKYVNKSGKPDKRFKDNRELPICLYGEIELKSSFGLNTVIMFSHVISD